MECSDGQNPQMDSVDPGRVVVRGHPGGVPVAARFGPSQGGRRTQARRPERAGQGAARRAGRSVHLCRQHARPAAGAGFCHGAEPADADGAVPRHLARRAGRHLRSRRAAQRHPHAGAGHAPQWRPPRGQARRVRAGLPASFCRRRQRLRPGPRRRPPHRAQGGRPQARPLERGRPGDAGALHPLHPFDQLQGRDRGPEADRQAGSGARQRNHAADGEPRLDRQPGCAEDQRRARRCARRAPGGAMGAPAGGARNAEPPGAGVQQLGGRAQPLGLGQGHGGQRPAPGQPHPARLLAPGGAVHAGDPGRGRRAARHARHPGGAHEARGFRRDQRLRRRAGRLHRNPGPGRQEPLPPGRQEHALHRGRRDDPHQGQGRARRRA